MTDENVYGGRSDDGFALPQPGTPEYDHFVQHMRKLEARYESEGVPAEGTPEYEEYVRFVQLVQALYDQAGVPAEGTPEYEEYMRQMQAQYAQYQQREPTERTFVPDYVPQNTNVSIDDMKVSNTAQRIRVIIGVAVVLIAAAVGIFVFMSSAKDIQSHKDARAAFDAAHKKGAAFLLKAHIETASFKDASEFNLQVLRSLRKSRVQYAKLIKEEALPILDGALPALEAVKAPEAYADKHKAAVDAFKGMREAFADFGGQLLMIDGLLDAKTKLRRMNDAWFNAQTWEDPQYGVEAFRYYKLLSCLLDGRPLIEIPAVDLMNEVSKGCSERKDAWFKRASLECFPHLVAADAQPDTGYNETVAAYRKKGAEKPSGAPSVIDETSLDAINLCVEECQREFENSLANKLRLSWEKYEAARKAFVAANNQALGL